MKRIHKYMALLLASVMTCACYEDYISDYDYPNMGFALGRQVRTVVSSTNLIYVGVSIGGKREVDMTDWAQFTLDESLLGGTPYIMLPESYYEMSHPNLFLVRRKNLAVADVGITFTDDFYNDPACMSSTYAIPFRLVATSIPATADSTGYTSPYGAIRYGAETAIIAVKYINQYSGTYYKIGRIQEIDKEGNPVGDATEYIKNNLSSNETVTLVTKGRYSVYRPGYGNLPYGGLLISVSEKDKESHKVSAVSTDKSIELIAFNGSYIIDGDYRLYTGDEIAPQFNLAYTIKTESTYYRIEETLVLRQWAERELRVETF